MDCLRWEGFEIIKGNDTGRIYRDDSHSKVRVLNTWKNESHSSWARPISWTHPKNLWRIPLCTVYVFKIVKCVRHYQYPVKHVPKTVLAGYGWSDWNLTSYMICIALSKISGSTICDFSLSVICWTTPQFLRFPPLLCHHRLLLLSPLCVICSFLSSAEISHHSLNSVKF